MEHNTFYDSPFFQSEHFRGSFYDNLEAGKSVRDEAYMSQLRELAKAKELAQKEQDERVANLIKRKLANRKARKTKLGNAFKRAKEAKVKRLKKEREAHRNSERLRLESIAKEAQERRIKISEENALLLANILKGR